jgi:dCMP deaminase
MTPAAVVAYVPVLHEGYRRFLEAHGRDRPLHLIGPELYADYRPLAKDVRALDAEHVAAAIAAWGICSEVSVLDEAAARELGESGIELVLPAEDVSYLVVERWLASSPVRYATVFLRWDKTRTVQMLEPAAPEISIDDALADLLPDALREAAESVDFWRRVGAAIRFADGTVAAAHNAHGPHPLSAYAVGDPRSNFSKGVHLELTTAMHAEAALIAGAARAGTATEGAVMFVTDFPCPPCAKLIAEAGVRRLYFHAGYAVLDGEDVLERAGVETLRVAAPAGA